MQSDEAAEQLPPTDRHDRPDPTTAISPFTPVMRWVAERQLRIICIAIAIFSPLLALWWTQSSIRAVKAATWTYNVDATGAITYAPVALAEPESMVYREVGLQAAQMYFTRNPKGLSFPEFAERLFTDEAMKLVNETLRSQRAERERRNLFDQPEIAEVKVRDPGLLRYRVVGFVVRSGAVDALPLRDVGDFVMVLELVPQPALVQKARYPFAVSRFSVKITWRSDGVVETWPQKEK